MCTNHYSLVISCSSSYGENMDLNFHSLNCYHKKRIKIRKNIILKVILIAFHGISVFCGMLHISMEATNYSNKNMCNLDCDFFFFFFIIQL